MKARKKHQENVLNNRSAFYNFDYKLLLEKFKQINLIFIETEEGRDELENYIKENNFCTRTIPGQSYYALKKLKKKAADSGLKSNGYRSLRDLSHISYQDLIKIIFYGRLTELRRAKASWVGNIGGIFKIRTQTGEYFNLNLQDENAWIDQEQEAWMTKQAATNPDFRLLVLGET